MKTWNREIAYIAGLIWSDGCLSKDSSSHGYRITLTMTDEILIKQIQSYIIPNRKLYMQVLPNRKKKYSIVIQNPAIVDFYIAANLTERKSKKLFFPIIPEKFYPDFIRGYFDGDGSVFYTNPNYLGVRFTCGDEAFLEQLNKILPIDMHLTKDSRKNVWYLSIYSKRLIKIFAKWIYDNNPMFYLERKRKIFQDNDMV